MIENFKKYSKLSSQQALELNPLSLAFVGDAVWTLLVRQYFCEHTHFKNNNLHRLTTKFVKATYQAKALEEIEKEFDETEKYVSKRARNTKINTISKNASLLEYKKSTSFEAVIGFLYLTGFFERLQYFFDKLVNNYSEAIK